MSDTPDELNRVFNEHKKTQIELRDYYTPRYTEAYNDIDGLITSCVSVVKIEKEL